MTLRDLLLHPSDQLHHWLTGYVAAPLDAVYDRIDEDLRD
jgi:hypothetical protein